MSYAAFNTALETHIAANYYETPVQYENAPQPDLTEWKEWIAVNTAFIDTEPRTLTSTPEYHQRGLVFVRVFTPDDIGSKRAREIVDSIIPVLSNRNIGDAFFWQASAVDVGPRDGYYQINIQAPFYRRVT